MNSIKFSIIIPIYNVEKYVTKCLDSVLSQSYDNFEIIAVDDGSTDKSGTICDSFSSNNKKVRVFHKKNGGLSDARNYGLDYVSGDYILFVDSDDYIDNNLLKQLYNTLSTNPVDLVRFGLKNVDESYTIISKTNEIELLNVNTCEVVDQLISTGFLDPACLYCYKTNFFKKNNFKYEVGRLHEDFGLTPLVICKAKTFSWINYNGYNYLQRNGSIVRTSNYNKTKQKTIDTLFHYDRFLSQYNSKSLIQKKMLCYLTECLICKGKYLNKKDFKLFKKKLLTRKIVSRIYAYNYKKLIKKVTLFISIDLYVKIFCR